MISYIFYDNNHYYNDIKELKKIVHGFISRGRYTGIMRYVSPPCHEFISQSYSTIIFVPITPEKTIDMIYNNNIGVEITRLPIIVIVKDSKITEILTYNYIFRNDLNGKTTEGVKFTPEATTLIHTVLTTVYGPSEFEIAENIEDGNL